MKPHTSQRSVSKHRTPHLRLYQPEQATAPRRFNLSLVVRCGVFGYVLALACATHVSGSMLPNFKAMHVSDKVLHFGAYAMLTALVVAAAATLRPVQAFCARRGRLLPALVVLVTLCGVWLVDELTQPAFGRQFDWLDWAADVAGCTTSIVALALLLYNRFRETAADATERHESQQPQRRAA
ncbi:MAG: VanZ family protein [Planctomycetia bacterium]|nr:VanZ family protein [Planctomycetia bacterium]